MNRLQHETSAYLLRHADNPVHWHPWDAEALDLAKRNNKPILLSIGYAANHQCRVMASESFESAKVAKFMNDNFVNILVDREERPDLDRIYQNAQQLLNRQPGGWPLTMFLDPTDQLPIFGGTYFPPQQTRKSPSFRDVLSGIAKTFDNQNEKMKEFKTKLHEALTIAPGVMVEGELDISLIDRACGQIDGSFDEKNGGFSEAPKLPHPAGLDLMLDVASDIDTEEKSTRLLYMLDHTLSAMSRGGLFDHLAGGFFGHSVDAEWTIPHFEKMLFDNGALLSLYARRAEQIDSAWFRDVANRSADWLLRDLQLEDGGFCASLAADVQESEGSYYVWSRDALREAAGDDFEPFAECFGVNSKANFGASWHLRLTPPASQDNPADQPLLPAEVDAARARVLAARDATAKPERDLKIVTAWNALAVRGLVDAYTSLGRQDCLSAATKTIDYLHATHWQAGRLSATSYLNQARHDAYLDDYAYLLEALLALLAVRWRDSDLEFAITLADTMLEHYEDKENGGFYFTSSDHEKLIQRPKPVADDSLPSGNGSAAQGLLELGYLLNESRFIDAAERTVRASMNDIERWPSAHAALIQALRDLTAPPKRIVLRSDDHDAVLAWREIVRGSSWRSRCYVIPTTASWPADASPGKSTDEEAAVTAYVLQGENWGDPIAELEGLAARLKS